MTHTLHKFSTKINNWILKKKQMAVIRQTVKELESMSDRELYDIGISRYDIPRLARDSVII